MFGEKGNSKKLRLLKLLFMTLFVFAFCVLPGAALADGADSGNVVLSFELYDADNDQVTLLQGPQTVAFTVGDTGLTLIREALGDEGVGSGGYIDALTFGETTYAGDYVNCKSWSTYLNNAPDLVGAGSYTPTDGDVYRVVYTTYDAGTYQFPAMANDLDALYHTMADAAALGQTGIGAYTDALSLIASGPVQTNINEANTSLAGALDYAEGTSYALNLDYRTMRMDPVAYSYTPTLTISAAKAQAGTAVTVTVNELPGITLEDGSLRANGVVLTDPENDGSYEFNMPQENVAVMAEFTETPALLDVSFAGGTLGEEAINYTPGFSSTASDYELTVYEDQLTEAGEVPGINLSITSTDEFATAAEFCYTTLYGGYPGYASSTQIDESGQAFLTQDALFPYDGLEHYIKITPQNEGSDGVAQYYYFTTTFVPVLQDLNLQADGEAVTFTFDSHDFNYNIIVPDDTAALTVLPTAYGVSDISVNGSSTAPFTVTPDIDGVTGIAVTVEQGDFSAVYNLTVKTQTVADAERTAKRELADEIMAGIAGHTQNTYAGLYPDEWEIMDMSAYGQYDTATAFVDSESTRQAYIDDAIKDVAEDDASDSTLAKHIIILKSLGYDAQQLTTVNKTAVDAVDKLLDYTTTSIYSAPYVLLAFRQDDYDISAAKIQSVVQIMKDNQMAGGLYGYEWGGVSYTDISTTGAVLAALAPYCLALDDTYGVKTDAAAIVDAAVAALSAAQGEDGSFGNANDDALAIIGLSALGIDPDTDVRFVKDGHSLLDGLLSYKNETNDGFLYYGSANTLATEQAFRALIAFSRLAETAAPYNIYDFSANSSNAAAAASSGSDSTPSDPSSDEDITVYFMLKGDSVHGETGHVSYPTWISSTRVTIPSDATVYNLIVKVLDEKGFVYDEDGAADGYLEWIQIPGSTERLSGGDNGTNSGWLYMVNNEAPSIPILDYELSGGDKVVLYYTDDWTKDSSAGRWLTSGSSAATTATGDNIATAEIKATASGTMAKGNISGTTLSDFIKDIANTADYDDPQARIIVTLPDKASGLTLNLPSSVVDALSEVSGITLQVQSDLAGLEFNSAATAALIKQAGSSAVNILCQKKDNSSLNSDLRSLNGTRPVYELELKIGSSPLAELSGGQVSVSLPYAPVSGENSAKLTVYRVNSDGAGVEVSGAAYDTSSQTMQFSTNTLGSVVIVYDENKSETLFSDVPSGHWACGYISYLVNKGVVKGKSNDFFAPSDCITRAEFVAILARMSGDTLPAGTSNFTDVASSSWYASYIAWAVDNSVTNGLSASSFSPNAPISRQDMAVMLVRYAAYMGYALPAVNETVDFKDSSAIAAYAQSAVAKMQQANIINGKDGGLFGPKDMATRAEAAKMLAILLQMINQ